MLPARRSGITLEEPDVAHWRLVGDVTPDDIRGIYEVQTKFCEGKPYIFVLVDVSEIRSISADARRIAAEGPKIGNLVLPVRANAVVGASFHFRIVGTLIAKAAKLIHRSRENPTRFFENAAEARAWFAERRLEIGASSLHPIS
jgi:hypothetical protein